MIKTFMTNQKSQPKTLQEHGAKPGDTFYKEGQSDVLLILPDNKVLRLPSMGIAPLDKYTYTCHRCDINIEIIPRVDEDRSWLL